MTGRSVETGEREGFPEGNGRGWSRRTHTQTYGGKRTESYMNRKGKEKRTVGETTVTPSDLSLDRKHVSEIPR